MDQALLTVAAGMRARMETLEVLGNNIANAPTSGYKADREFYRLFATAEARLDMGLGERPWMPVVGGSVIDFGQGPLIQTEGPLDVALSGPGFLVVQSPNGDLYTRSGSLQRSSAGVLSTFEGYPVAGSRGEQIRLPATGEIDIRPDGVVSVDGLVAGLLQMVEFPGRPPLSKVGRSYFAAPQGVLPQPASATTMKQGYIEGSNVEPTKEAVNLIMATRHFEMMRRVASLVGDQMDGRAVEELGRTS